MKIDNSLISNLEDNPRDVSACAATLQMANALGLEIIAEGIETKYQADVLRSLGCRYLQGFLMSTPMTASETLEYLEFNAPGTGSTKGSKWRILTN